MHPRRLLSILAGTIAVALSFAPAQGERLFAISGAAKVPSILYELNPATGAVINTIGNTGVVYPQHITSLAFHPVSGVLYGYINEYTSYNVGRLATIDINTGAATALALDSPLHVPDITFSPAGTLYGWSEASGPDADDLFAFDIATGAAVKVGDSGIGTQLTGLASDSKGNLYVKPMDQLYTVNPVTGAATFLIQLSQSLHNSLAFDENDNLYSVLRTSETSYLMRIDIATGAVTTVGDIGVKNIAALAFQPMPTPTEPTTWGRFKHSYR